MKAYLYCDKRSLNDATIYYVGIIKDCLTSLGYDYEICHSVFDIKKPDLILTITERYFCVAKFRFPFVKTIYWAQGIDAEEAKLTSLGGWRSTIRYYFRLFSENLAVNTSTLLFCVSDRMKSFFKDKYGYKDNGNCIIMPCYNLGISSDFDLKQYENPTFVYAGGSSVWQGVDFMLEVFFKIQKEIPESRLIILTGEKEIFQEKINSIGIKNFEIKYVPVDKLPEELHKYKYGFIIRDGHIVNEVATPTKMNSYLANYLIPIFSDAVDDFKKNIRLGDFSLMAQIPLSSDVISRRIIDFEKESHDYSIYEGIVNKIFDTHYNDNQYKMMIKSKIKAIILNLQNLSMLL